jgi:hypothetical protein
LVEQLIRNQQVIGSSPIAGSSFFSNLTKWQRRDVGDPALNPARDFHAIATP